MERKGEKKRGERCPPIGESGSASGEEEEMEKGKDAVSSFLTEHQHVKGHSVP